MKTSITLSLLVATAFVLLQYSTVEADMVLLKNGDRLTGSIVRMEGGRLVMKTEYANELSIRWDKVKTLQSDLPVLIHLAGGDRLEGRLAAEEEGLSIVAEDEKRGLLAMEDIISVNLPPTRADRGVRLAGHINAGLSSAAGNSETESIYINTEMTLRTLRDRYTLSGQVRQVEDRGKQTEANWLANLKYDRFLTEKWYGYGSANFEHDTFKDIRLRSAMSAGGGYQAMESDRTNLYFEGGLTYIHTALESGNNDAHMAGRWSTKFDQGLFQMRTRFFHFHEIFVGLEEIKKTFIRTQTGLRFPIVERLNATAQYNLDWDNQPSPGRERTDRMLLLTLGYNW